MGMSHLQEHRAASSRRPSRSEVDEPMDRMLGDEAYRGEAERRAERVLERGGRQVASCCLFFKLQPDRPKDVKTCSRR